MSRGTVAPTHLYQPGNQLDENAELSISVIWETVPMLQPSVCSGSQAMEQQVNGNHRVIFILP